MDGCIKRCEIDTVSFTCKSLQVLPSNNTIIEKINGSNRRCQITDFIQYIHSKSMANLKECVAAIVLL